MQPGHPSGDGEAKPSAPCGALDGGARRIASVEAFEDVRLRLLRNARTGIRYDDRIRVVCPSELEMHGGAGQRMLEAVVEYVNNQMLDQLFVAGDRCIRDCIDLDR